jgi:hypothetical protein
MPRVAHVTEKFETASSHCDRFVFNMLRKSWSIGNRIASENRNSFEVKFLKFRCVERLWNRLNRQHLLGGLKNIFHDAGSRADSRPQRPAPSWRRPS